jgi:hypothetical protein
MNEFMQPINPIRVWTRSDNFRFAHPVFAIAISNSHDVEYLTINGQFMSKTEITHTEVMLNGQWTALHTLEIRHPAPLDA